VKILIPLLLVVAGSWSIREWYSDRYEAEPVAKEAPAEIEAGAPPDRRWLSDWLGGVTSPPLPGTLRADLARWGPPASVEGWDHLSRPGIGPAARAELARWLQLSTSENSRATELIIAPTPDGKAVDLKVTLHGPAAALLPWLHHLLELPEGSGYLTDPQRLRFYTLGESGIAANLTVRVLPAATLLSMEGAD